MCVWKDKGRVCTIKEEKGIKERKNGRKRSTLQEISQKDSSEIELKPAG